MDELKLIAKSRVLKTTKTCLVISALSKPKIDNERLKKIRKDLNRLKTNFLNQK